MGHLSAGRLRGEDLTLSQSPTQKLGVDSRSNNTIHSCSTLTHNEPVDSCVQLDRPRPESSSVLETQTCPVRGAGPPAAGFVPRTEGVPRSPEVFCKVLKTPEESTESNESCRIWTSPAETRGVA
ncbi:unnamed protein product [Pleuronectes platessa]|uniref:Uncharacterized protein n=1 Tax=Pleuronectes platessa TaxID=8262 RepID=A0A9N7VSC7_PLEPL|nr:unnamed protein product [Pleuronectes platessa]